jgi:hypothetical protein
MLCIYYNHPDMDLQDCDQIKIDYRPQDNSLREFVNRHENQHIYITVAEDTSLSQLNLLREGGNKIIQYSNWTLQIPLNYIINSTTGKIDLIKFNAVKDCCNSYMFTDLIGNWEVLQFVLTLRPTEVYITNILGFCLPGVSAVCAKAGARIRVYANVAQSAWEDSPSIKKFFIRPEDIWYYKNYINGGFEFKTLDSASQQVIYKAYKDEKWYGDLSEIIIGLDESLDSRRLPPSFGALRAECNKRCITGSSCSACRSMQSFSKILEKTNAQILPPNN